MKRQAASRLAWGTCALTLVFISCIVVSTFLNRRGFEDLSFSIVGVSSTIVGAVVASKKHSNFVGWLFLFAALLFTAQGPAAGYAVYGILTDPGGVPVLYAAAWFSNVIQLVGPVLIFVLRPLYFPTGRPVSRRWGILAWLALGVLPVVALLVAVSPGEVVNGTGIQNPVGVEQMRQFESVLGFATTAWFIGLIFASAASLVVRFRCAAGEERQQIRWVVYAVVFMVTYFALSQLFLRDLIPIALDDLLLLVSLEGLWIAFTVAILRYHLYDIDVLINRTLVYGAVTAVLAAVYFGTVIMLQYAFRAVTEGDSQLAVVASTLAIAALFNPLRQRVQAFVDRRFYRNKYDAARTLEDLGAKLRDETDLDALGEDLEAAVRKTMQPEHVSLWLRQPHNVM